MILLYYYYSDRDTKTNVYLAEDAVPKVKTVKHLDIFLVNKGGNDINFTELRIEYFWFHVTRIPIRN